MLSTLPAAKTRVLVSGALIMLLAAALILGTLTAQAAALVSRASFSPAATVLTFAELRPFIVFTPITNQFAAQGVTFSGTFYAWENSFGKNWPGSGAPVAANFAIGPSSDVTSSFSPPVTRVGFEITTASAQFVELRAYLNGVLVDSIDFPTGLTPGFIGLEVPGGFDTLVIQGHLPLSSASVPWILDDFTFEDAVIGGGVVGDDDDSDSDDDEDSDSDDD